MTTQKIRRGVVLTDKGLRAIGVSPTVYVPLLNIPARDDDQDRRDSDDERH